MLTGHRRELLYELDLNVHLIWIQFTHRWPINHIYLVFFLSNGNSLLGVVCGKKKKRRLFRGTVFKTKALSLF